MQDYDSVVRAVMLCSLVALGGLTCAAAFAAPAQPRPVLVLLLRPHEMPGFRLSGRPKVVGTIKSFVLALSKSGGTTKGVAESLRLDGFVASAYEFERGLPPQARAEGESSSAMFRSAAGATRYKDGWIRTAEYDQTPGWKIQRLRLPGIAGSVAVVARDPKSHAGSVNAAFTVGDCVVTIGDVSLTAVLRFSVYHAAQEVFARRAACS
jgi:hypothetical protein